MSRGRRLPRCWCFGRSRETRRPRRDGEALVRKTETRVLIFYLSREFDPGKVDVKFGRATLVEPSELLVKDSEGATERVAAEHVILATGSRPAYPGQEQAGVLNTDQVLRNTSRPEHLFVIGGGYVG